MSKINGIGIGVSYGNSSGSGSLIDSSTFFAPLKTSLVLQRGTGDPTWSRATKAWGFNELGYLVELASGCAFFGGARLVRNFLTYSQEFNNAAWTKRGAATITANATTAPDGTITADLVTALAGVGTNDLFQNNSTVPSGSIVAPSFYIKRVSTTGTLRVSNPANSSNGRWNVNLSLLSDNWERITLSHPAVTVAANFIGNGGGDGIIFDCITGAPISFYLWGAQIANVTNYDASYVPEYVSVGVVATPFFGAGIDGAKYFNTGWNGSPLTLQGFRREAAATNNLLGSRDLFINWTPGVVAGTLFSDDFSSYADTAAMTAAGWTAASNTTQTLDAAAILITNAGAVYGSSSKAITTEIGKSYLVTFAFTKTTANCGSYVANTATASTIDRLNTASATVTGAYSLVFTATATTTYLVFGLNSNTVGHEIKIDDVLVKESKVTVTKATGLDGIANTATTLTATAADAIILQPITLASAARCASAYVKRRTGTGTISFTQDGGSTWTDITAQINGSTWSRVQITSTLANPSTGFKISTSGDAIDVDCVQNEAGAEATSPIVTTTTAITRNADSLTYPAAGNVDLAVGTVYSELLVSSASIARRAVYVGSVAASYVDGSSTVWKAYDGTNTVTKSGLSDASTAKRKRVVTWGTGMSVTGDGLTPASGSFDGAFGAATTIDIGNTINGYIGPVAIWNYQMTDAQLQAITS